jgi:ubiquinone/menaquinone biosynthesis C-methylase UbiE
MNALCMLISSPYFRIARTSFESALRYLPIDRVYLAMAPKWREREWDTRFAGIAEDKQVTLCEGAGSWNEVGSCRAGIFDRAAAEGAEWMFSVDDDDGVLGAVDPAVFGPEVGAFHTDILAVCREASGETRQPGDVFLRHSHSIMRRADANVFMGSFYGYRAAAWQQVSPLLDRSYTDYEEWRVVWHMLNAGWKIQHIPHVLQWQGVRDFVDQATMQKQACGRSWIMVQNQLEAVHGSQDDGDRWWQNWNIDAKRLEVEDFWRDDPAQTARRKQLYNMLRTEVIPNLPRKQVLDHGCGVAWDQPEFVKLGLKYAGADVTEEMLERARERVPDLELYTDDVFNSQFKDQQWPLVVNSAVLPHLPLDRVPSAISELWRITGDCLVIRLFGVNTSPKDASVLLKGFIYNRLRAETWMKMIKEGCTGAVRIDWHSLPDSRSCKDILIACVWRR